MLINSELELIVDSQSANFSKRETGMERDKLSQIAIIDGFVTVLSGVRRCGKSTLMRQLIANLNVDSLFLNFEDTRLTGFTISDFNRLLQIINSRQLDYLFFDEIQVVDGWEMMVRALLDEGKQVFVSGSNAAMLSTELGTKLTGRHLSTELFPFNYQEFIRFRNLSANQQSFGLYLDEGGFPDYLKTQNAQLLRQLLDDILIRDIAVRYAVRDVTSLKQLCIYLISNIGKPVSATSLTKLFAIKSVSTILEYFSYFENSYLLQFLPKFSYSIKAQVRNPKKVYAIDLGLFMQNSIVFSEEKGRRLENAVYLHLRRSWKEIYYFNEKKECDFVVVERGSVKFLIQVCYELNNTNKTRELEGLYEALNFFNHPKGYLLTMNQRDTIFQNNATIEVMPCFEFFTNDNV